MKKILLFILGYLFCLVVLFSAKSVKAGEHSFFYNKNAFNFFLNKGPVCTDCHSDVVAKKTKHAAALDNSCANCHQNSGKEHPGDSSKMSLIEKVPLLCNTCHDAVANEIASSRVVHSAVKEKKSCTNCHSPHSSDNGKLLILEEKELCLSCHNKTITVGTKKFTNIQQLLKNSKTIHPALEGGCSVCHKPHASKNNFLLTKNFPSGNYTTATKDTFALCWDCHDSGLLETKNTTSATSFRNGNVNLHYLHMNGSKARSCAMCHNMHASANQHLILDKVTFGEWEMEMNYTPSETGGSCLAGCHAEKKYTR
jgi:predicted CXXCH cytochrome family protein